MPRKRDVGSLGLVSLALALAGCAGQPSALPAQQHPYASNKGYILGPPYEVGGVWYYPHLSPHYNKTGIASWYGIPFNGRLTADGEIYDENALTAASPTLPLPSYVRVTDLQNGRSVVLRVNDRGPFVNGRLLDVTRRAAQLLGFEQAGTAEVRVQAVPGPGGTPIPGTPGVMVAARGRVPANRVPPAQVSPGAAPVSAAPLAGTAVTAEPLPAGGPVAARPERLAAVSPTRQRAVDPPAGQPASAAATATIPVPQLVAVPPGASRSHWVSRGSDLMATFRQEPVRPTRIYIQAGAFESYANANHLRHRLAPIGTVLVSEITIRGTRFFRVRLGPIRTVGQADQMLQKLINIGETGARIVVD